MTSKFDNGHQIKMAAIYTEFIQVAQYRVCFQPRINYDQQGIPIPRINTLPTQR